MYIEVLIKKESGIYETFEGTWKQDGDTPYIKIDIKKWKL